MGPQIIIKSHQILLHMQNQIKFYCFHFWKAIIRQQPISRPKSQASSVLTKKEAN